MDEGEDPEPQPEDEVELDLNKSKSDKPTVLVPIIDEGKMDYILEIALIIAEEKEGELFIIEPAVYPDLSSLEPPLPSFDEHQRTAAKYVLKTKRRTDLPVNGMPRAGRGTTRIIKDTVNEFDIDTVVVEPFDETGTVEKLRDEPVNRLFKSLECDVVVPQLDSDLSDMNSVLLAVSGGPHTRLTTELTRMIGTRNDAKIMVIHVVEEKTERAMDRASDYIDEAREMLNHLNVSTQVIEGDVPSSIIAESEKYDLTLIGAPTRNRLQRLVFGSSSREIRQNAENTITASHRNS